jgi:hypothetical protein
MKVNVAKKQAELAQRGWAGLEEILTPRCSIEHWRRRKSKRNWDNNAQSILGYVARWIDQGVGCSKRPTLIAAQTTPRYLLSETESNVRNNCTELTSSWRRIAIPEARSPVRDFFR